VEVKITSDIGNEQHDLGCRSQFNHLHSVYPEIENPVGSARDRVRKSQKAIESGRSHASFSASGIGTDSHDEFILLHYRYNKNK